jgi:hypothetical protein
MFKNFLRVDKENKVICKDNDGWNSGVDKSMIKSFKVDKRCGKIKSREVLEKNVEERGKEELKLMSKNV